MELTGIFEAMVAALLLASGALSLIAALGLLRLRDFFQRMHAPALATTLGTWCVALASIVNFSVLDAHIDLRGMVVIILLALTAPITTTLLARATLFRQRSSAFLDLELRSWDERDAGLHNGHKGAEVSTRLWLDDRT